MLYVMFPAQPANVLEQSLRVQHVQLAIKRLVSSQALVLVIINLYSQISLRPFLQFMCESWGCNKLYRMSWWSFLSAWYSIFEFRKMWRKYQPILIKVCHYSCKGCGMASTPPSGFPVPPIPGLEGKVGMPNCDSCNTVGTNRLDWSCMGSCPCMPGYMEAATPAAACVGTIYHL